jgi:hypothetical protein
MQHLCKAIHNQRILLLLELLAFGARTLSMPGAGRKRNKFRSCLFNVSIIHCFICILTKHLEILRSFKKVGISGVKEERELGKPFEMRID